MDHNLTYYLFCLIAIIAGILIVKKVASCLIRTVVIIILLAVLTFCYFQIAQ